MARRFEQPPDAAATGVGLGRARVAHRDHGTAGRTLAVRVVLVRSHPGSERLGVRLDLGGAGRTATLADVLVLVALEEHQEEPLADGHRLAAARAVEQRRLEGPVGLWLASPWWATTQHGRGLAPSPPGSQSWMEPACQPIRNRRVRATPSPTGSQSAMS